MEEKKKREKKGEEEEEGETNGLTGETTPWDSELPFVATSPIKKSLVAALATACVR